MSKYFIYLTLLMIFLPSCYFLYMPFPKEGIHYRDYFMLCDSNFNSDNKLANKILHRFINKDSTLLAKDDYNKTIYFQYDNKTIYDSMKTTKLDNGVILKSKKDEKYFLTSYNSLYYQKSYMSHKDPLKEINNISTYIDYFRKGFSNHWFIENFDPEHTDTLGGYYDNQGGWKLLGDSVIIQYFKAVYNSGAPYVMKSYYLEEKRGKINGDTVVLNQYYKYREEELTVINEIYHVFDMHDTANKHLQIEYVCDKTKRWYNSHYKK